METAYVLVQCKIAHEMEVLKALLDIDLVKEAKGTFGYYDIFTKIQGESSSQIEDVITKKIRNIPSVTCLLYTSPSPRDRG